MKTSYVKMIDIWYFGTLCIPFIEVIAATAVEYLKSLLKKVEEDNPSLGHITMVAPLSAMSNRTAWQAVNKYALHPVSPMTTLL